jgi:hypothetical protein
MTKSPVNNGINSKKERGGQNEIKFPSQKKSQGFEKET